jgi:hypothetical protein
MMSSGRNPVNTVIPRYGTYAQDLKLSARSRRRIWRSSASKTCCIVTFLRTGDDVAPSASSLKVMR